MGIIDSIEKLITEHGSAAVLTQQLAFARDQFDALERKVSELQTQVGRFEAQLERERADHKQAHDELQRLKDEHAEDIRIHLTMEFRKGKRTNRNWAAFCPKCHMPLIELFPGRQRAACCSAKCGWIGADLQKPLLTILQEFGSMA